jgi:hypothetical protein
MLGFLFAGTVKISAMSIRLKYCIMSTFVVTWSVVCKCAIRGNLDIQEELERDRISSFLIYSLIDSRIST